MNDVPGNCSVQAHFLNTQPSEYLQQAGSGGSCGGGGGDDVTTTKLWSPTAPAHSEWCCHTQILLRSSDPLLTVAWDFYSDNKSSSHHWKLVSV